MLGKNPPQKPIGVYIGSMLIIIGFGIVPFLPTFKMFGDTWGSSFGALPFNGILDFFYGADSDPSLILVFVTLFLRLFTLASALWTLFTSHNEARHALLGFTSLNYLSWAFMIVSIIASKETQNVEFLELVLIMIKPTIIIGIIWWYFTKTDVVNYYREVALISK